MSDKDAEIKRLTVRNTQLATALQKIATTTWMEGMSVRIALAALNETGVNQND